jgi:trimeric autotransporter adhesin
LKATVRGIPISVLVAILFALPLTLHAQQPSPTPTETRSSAAQTPPTNTYEITGLAHSGKSPLPGATITAANTLTGKKYAVVTDNQGNFNFTNVPRGRYVIRIEFMGFAIFTQEVVLNPQNLSAKIDAELTLASRQQQQSNGANVPSNAGRNSQLPATMDNSEFGGAGARAGAQNNADFSSLPLSGAGVDVSTESVSITGAQTRTQDFGNGNDDERQERMDEFRDRVQATGNNPFGGGPNGLGGSSGQGQGNFGGPGGGGGGGPIAIGRTGGRGLSSNQPHGFMYYSNDNAELDAAPYSLSGITQPKLQYNQSRFGANVGGPINIPKIFNGGNKWFGFAAWNGSRGDTPYDFFSRVPTAAERNGDFSNATYNDGRPVQLFDLANGQLYQFNGVANQLNPTLITPQARALLQYIPLPNIATTAGGQNFQFLTSAPSNSDAIILRLTHNFNATTSNQGFGGRGGGGGGGRAGGRRSQNNMNFGLNWARTSTSIVAQFPALDGHAGTQGLNASGGWTYGKNRFTNIFRVNYNHNHVSTTNLYSEVLDVAGNAGIGGISTAPFDWGLPGINFTSFGGLSDPTPRRELDQTYTVSDTFSWNKGKHNWRFGGDYRRILQSFQSARNAEGNFVFTGFATSLYAAGSTQPLSDTGYDFADFLLGLPQQASQQFGANSYNFRANSFDLFAQNDWRIFANLSLNLGVRYEYVGPYTEADNRIANLEVRLGFATAVPVVPVGAVLPPGSPPFQTSPLQSLIHPDRNNFAPRIGIAWKPIQKTVVRAGYGINYNLAQYEIMIQNFAFQPPFANTATNVASIASLTVGTPLTLANGFPTALQGTVTNNFAVDPNYALGHVQIWNLDIQHEFKGNVVVNIGYNGAKGTRLDTERALVVDGDQPFIYESSEGSSILHAATVRARRRMSKGLGIGMQYIFSKSLDDAASIGGGGVVVAQNPFDISVDRSLSSFNQTHRFTGNWMYDLPFGENRRFFSQGHGLPAKILSNWQWSGSFTVASGLYFTPSVLGSTLDIDRGVSGSLRANVVPGQPISISNPTALDWFNKAAFCTPGINCANPNGTPYGDAGRYTIEGPGTFTMNMTLNRTIPIKETRALDLRIAASNIFNHANYASINSVVNSLTFGEVTSVSNMRRVTLQARFRF